MEGLFVKSRVLEEKLDEFLTLLEKSGIQFKQIWNEYLSADPVGFEENCFVLSRTEHDADALRRSIEESAIVECLYTQYTEDVIELFDGLDSVIDSCKRSVMNLSIECPEIPEDIGDNFRTLVGTVADSVDVLTLACRVYLTGTGDVLNHLHKALFFRRETDAATLILEKRIFSSRLPLAHKNQLGFFSLSVRTVADRVGEVANLITVLMARGD